MPVIQTSEGRLIDYPEGELRKPIPVVKKRKQPPPKYPDDPRHTMCDRIPGYREWFAARHSQTNPYRKHYGPCAFGGSGGGTVYAFNRAWIKSRREAKRDMDEIKKTIDLTAAAQEALETSLTVMRGPVSAGDKLKAARQVLDFTMAKPVSKSEVTVNSAEEWLKSLVGKDAD